VKVKGILALCCVLAGLIPTVGFPELEPVSFKACRDPGRSSDLRRQHHHQTNGYRIRPPCTDRESRFSAHSCPWET
jgi:hypothetical protein